MRKSRARRAIVIGLDGAIPGFILKFRDKLPNMDALIRRGVFSPAIPSHPTDTPTNWTTIATGAWTGTHGVNGFYVHKRGEPLDRTHFAFNSDLCQAEYIWEALERGGRRSILVNYPVAFPIRTKESIVVGGDGLFPTTWSLADSAFYVSTEQQETGKIDFGISPKTFLIELRRAEGWNVRSALPPLEARIPLLAGVRTGWGARGAIIGEEEKRQEGPFYYLLVTASSPDRYDQTHLFKEKNAEPLVSLKEGDWSGDVFDRFRTPDGEKDAFTRFKLARLSRDGKEVKLLRTYIHTTR
ncbi:TPA: hypothetical protein ENG04_09975, partial [Candidatus Poribacteria bacterium]|nr:hypothetical protein [Candidatus Poribacteria bacterium]HEX30395.1 hypothetical protein [Candidatus Poribacteria bacterium]